MEKQIQAHPDKKTISDLIGKIKRKELVLQPDFQRKFVWTKIHMEQFIKTILSGYPFPEIYISQVGIDLETLSSENVVVDGQQRLTTILNYIDGDGEFEVNIRKFAELSDIEQKMFLNYDVIVRDLKDIDQKTLIEIFKRINSTKFSLKDIEINNAVYDGEFITCGKEILEEIGELEIPIFKESELTRMADLHFILLVLATFEESGYFSNDNSLEDYIVRFNENYPQKEDVKKLFITIIKNILNSELPKDSIWYRKSTFFTLICEMSFKNMSNPIDSLFVNKLTELEGMILANKGKDETTNEYARFYAKMTSATNSRTARVLRGELLKKIL